MTPPESIVHDLQIFMLLWNKELEHYNIMRDHLNKKYNITNTDACDENWYYFTCNKIDYTWDWLLEILYFRGHEEDYENSIISGPAYEYMQEFDKAISNAFENIEREMRYREWMYSKDEYSHILFKDGWMTDLSYWSGGCDFDDAVGEIDYEGDE